MPDVYITPPARAFDDFLGAPVLLQLKRPLLITQVTESRALTHAENKDRQWIPIEARAADGESLAASEFIRYAVIKSAWDRCLLVQWVAPGLTGEVIVESMIPIEDVAAVTRIAAAPPLPELPKLVTL